MARVELACRICGEGFVAVRRTVKYCSRRCRSAATYKGMKQRAARAVGGPIDGVKIKIAERDDSEATRVERRHQRAAAQARIARRRLGRPD